MGFCRTNLFKRLESCGMAFLQSVERHILRNFVYLHAIENGLPLPLGSQTSEMLDTRMTDEDAEEATSDLFADDTDNNDEERKVSTSGTTPRSEADFRRRAAEVYSDYETQHRRSFKWIRPGLFTEVLAEHLRADAEALLKLLARIPATPARPVRSLRDFTVLTAEQREARRNLAEGRPVTASSVLTQDGQTYNA